MKGNHIRARSSFEWDLAARLATEQAADALAVRDPCRAGRLTRLALAAQEVARLKRLEERK